MPASSKLVPFSLIGLGVVLVVAAVLAPVLMKEQTPASSAAVPARLAGLDLGSQMTGKQALSEFDRLHGQSIPVTGGAKAVYGSTGQISLWVAETGSGDAAARLVAAMRDKIAGGNSLFTPTGEHIVQNRDVYTLDGMGQKHFYFQSGRLVIWLASSPDRANNALMEVLDFYH